jgi:hypothetical protein
MGRRHKSALQFQVLPAIATINVLGVPIGTTAQVDQPSTVAPGMLTLISSPTTAAGNYSLQVVVTDGTSSTNRSLTLVVAVGAVIGTTVNQNQGVKGKLQEFLATSFQPAEWDDQFFQNHPAISTVNDLTTLGPQHIRIQALSQAIPMKSNSSPQQASDWNFAMLDAIVQPVLSAADHSLEFEIAGALTLAGMLDGNGHLIPGVANLNTLSTYCASLVRYYNTGGFGWGGTVFKSASPYKITWCGIFNEYNINGLTPSQYAQLYNAVVPTMLAVDPTIKISAIELADFDYQTGNPRNNPPTFAAAAGSGGVNAPVDIVSTHFYSSCNQKDTDVQLFNTVPGFVNDVKYIYQELQLRSEFASVTVWVTENNVNADSSDASGNSVCNPTQKFVKDKRGTSAFFAAWKPYVFAELGKAGNQAIYHWDYDADAQYGEVDYATGMKYLSYWVNYWLGQLYPQSPAAPDILDLAVTETTSVETLATRNADGSVVVMIADRAVLAPTDNKDTGDLRSIFADISGLGSFKTASQLNISASSDLINSPQPVSPTLAPKITMNLTGYGVTFLILKP